MFCWIWAERADSWAYQKLSVVDAKSYSAASCVLDSNQPKINSWVAHVLILTFGFNFLIFHPFSSFGQNEISVHQSAVALLINESYHRKKMNLTLWFVNCASEKTDQCSRIQTFSRQRNVETRTVRMFQKGKTKILFWFYVDWRDLCMEFGKIYIPLFNFLISNALHCILFPTQLKWFQSRRNLLRGRGDWPPLIRGEGQIMFTTYPCLH